MTTNLTNQQLKDIVDTAVQGDSIAVWVGRIDTLDHHNSVADAIVDGSGAIFVEVDYPDGFNMNIIDQHTLTLDRLKAGIDKYVASHTEKNPRFHFDIENLDDPQAVEIIEFAIFGELTYC